MTRPMLADQIDPAELPRFVGDDRWWFEQKVDGHRALILCEDGAVSVLNRSGDRKQDLIPPLADFAPLAQLTGSVVVDSEILAGRFVVFDLIRCSNFLDDLAPFSERRRVLEELWRLAFSRAQHARLIPVARTPEQKAHLATTALSRGMEGVMVKHHGAAYEPGPLRSAGVLKAKFDKEADVEITGLRTNGKNSADMAVYGPDGRVELGTVSMNGKDPRIGVGSVVTVRYAYATLDNHLYQPRIISGPRNDKRSEECLVGQLRYTDRALIEIR